MSIRTALTIFAFPVIVAAFIAVAFLLTPLPTLDAFGSPVGWCGPGSTSSNAVQVLLDPEQVIRDSDGARPILTDKGHRQLHSYCLGVAKDRVVYAFVSSAGGLLTGIGAYLIAALLVRQRRNDFSP